MHDKASNPLGLAPSTWITMAFAVMGIFALKQYPFQDTRPPDLWVPVYSHTASEDQDVEARLWQDPLAAVETARKVSEAPHDNAISDKAQGSGLPGVSSCADARKASGTEDPAVRDVHSARHMCQSIRAGLQESPAGVLVMGAIVSGAPYAADIESRRRTRYAVLAGLYRSGYRPVNNEHVGYVRLAEFYKDDLARANDLAAFEWFVSNDAAQGSRPARVLLLWLDQDGFRTNPIDQFVAIANGIMPGSVPTVLLGPADSDGLRAMAEEFKGTQAESTKGSRQISIYSPWATVADIAIAQDNPAWMARRFHSSTADVHMYRSIAPDSEIADAVRRELAARGVEIGEIALIAERDTLYARAMGEYFNGCANPPRPDPSSDPGDTSSNPLCLTYLKGLDGIGPPPPKQAGATNGANANEAKSSGQPSRANTAPDASTGPRQLDYLRRMGAALSAAQGKVPPECKASVSHSSCQPRYIKAIGVLGTDIYDKLLVLQQLRPQFPDAIFFTFGLDAGYTDQANLPWARQLLVGSSLGLSLRSELQGDIPAFRDAYQATTFYSTMLALHRAFAVPPDCEVKKNANDPWPECAGLQWTSNAQVFEIGRKKPIDLLKDKHASTPCVFDGKCPSLSETRTAAFADAVTQAAGSAVIVLVPASLWIMLRAAFGSAVMRRRFRRIPLNLTGLIVLLTVAAALAMRLPCVWTAVLNFITDGGGRMPVPIADGASHWGKELLEATMIPLVLALLIRGQRKLNENADKMRREFSFARDSRWLIRGYRSRLRRGPWTLRLKEWIYLPIGHLSKEGDAPPLLAGTVALESLIARYLYRGILEKRWARVSAATMALILILKSLEWLGFSLFTGVPWFVLHGPKHGWEGLISLMCVISMQVLILWVIDAILLTRAFLLDVARDEPQWPDASLEKTREDLGLSGDLATIWLNLRLIARRTSWVGQFIWYPSVVIAAVFATTFTVEFGRYHFDSNPVTLMVSVGLIVGAVVALRRAAESWRSELLRRLTNRRLRLLAAKLPDQPAEPSKEEAVTQLQVLIDLVTQLRDGAFAPYSEQPLVRAVLLPAVTFAATAGFPYLNLD
jgi:hypothetical protein